MNEQNVNEKKTHGIPQDHDGNQDRSADPMTPVTSSAFTHIHHRPETNVLTIRFNNGRENQYHNFSAEKYLAFIKADSLGKFFSDEIRNNPEHNERKQDVA